MDIWEFLLIFLSALIGLEGIPPGIVQRGYLLGINLQIIGVPATAVDQLRQMLEIKRFAVDPFYGNIKVPRFFLIHCSQHLSGHLR